MKKGKICLYEYEMDIYPRRLWVAIGVPNDKLREFFEDLEDTEDCYADVTTVREKKTERTGELVRIYKRSEMRPDIIAHEALHVVLDTFSYVGAKVHYDNQEPVTYFLGWVVRKIYMALKGDKEHLYGKKV